MKMDCMRSIKLLKVDRIWNDEIWIDEEETIKETVEIELLKWDGYVMQMKED
jgi:hypothetical protein